MTRRAPTSATRRPSDRPAPRPARPGGAQHVLVLRPQKVFAWRLAPGEAARACRAWYDRVRLRHRNGPGGYAVPATAVAFTGPWLTVDIHALAVHAGLGTPPAMGLTALRPWLEETAWEDRTRDADVWRVVAARQLPWAALARSTVRHYAHGVTLECAGWDMGDLFFRETGSTAGFGVTIAPLLVAWATEIRTLAVAAEWWTVLRTPGVCRAATAAVVLAHPAARALWTMVTPSVIRDLLDHPDPAVRLITIAQLAPSPERRGAGATGPRPTPGVAARRTRTPSR